MDTWQIVMIIIALVFLIGAGAMFFYPTKNDKKRKKKKFLIMMGLIGLSVLMLLIGSVVVVFDLELMEIFLIFYIPIIIGAALTSFLSFKKRIVQNIVNVVAFLLVFGWYGWIASQVFLQIRATYYEPPSFMSFDKPIIYLYPEQTTEVEITLGQVENLTHTYPKYEEEGWRVRAEVNGDLLDLKTGRKLYALYWEGKNEVSKEIEEGFVVAGEEVIGFLEEKLEILGLSEREANEFIIYWLPQLESNKYNLIRFQTKEEIDFNMPLTVRPEPDSVIRVMMEFKGLENVIEVKEQKLETPKREGFVVVEWGGTLVERSSTSE